MAEPTEPKKETVRIAVTPPASGQSAQKRETVRITLPSRPPTSAPLPPTGVPATAAPHPPVAKPLIPPAPTKAVQPPRFVPPPVSAAVPPMPNISPLPGPKKETARITVLPDPPAAPPTVQMKKTQPLINMPAASVPMPVTPVTVANEPEIGATIMDGIPIAFCWALVGVSAVVLLIQILNYIS